MLRENQYILRQVNLALDLALAAAAFFIAHLMRHVLYYYFIPDLLAPSRLIHYVWLLAAWPPAVLITLAWNGLYHSQRLRTRIGQLARKIGVAVIFATVIVLTIDFVLSAVNLERLPVPVDNTSRAMIMILPPVTFVLLVLKTWALRRVLMAVRQRGLNYRGVILVGSGAPLEEFVRTLAAHPIWGLRIEGIVTDRPEFQGAAFDADAVPEARIALPGGGEVVCPVLSDLDSAPALLWRTPVDEVIFVPEQAPLARLRPLMEICEEMGVRMHLPLNFYKGPISHAVMDSFDEISVLSYWPTRDIGPALLFKYAFDRVAAAALLLLLSPALLGVALAVRMTSPAGQPVFYGQTRCGLNGRLFTCWKFRTMRPDAERELAELRALSEVDGPVFKMERDPRVTPIGRWLRKFSVDELPQLWNVLKGEMSLVGPRPPIPAEVEQYDRWQRRRLSMKPGITCIWQVSGRNRLSFETWMNMDLEYIDNWSLALDFKILARTVYVVVTGYGAM